jgi:HlyD family secretion protein
MTSVKTKLLTSFAPIVLLCAFCLGSCSSDSSGELTVKKGHFVSSFIETGSLSAKSAVAVPLPRLDYRYGYAFKIIEMINSGSIVEEGDTLMKLDDTSIQRFILSTQEALENERAADKKLAVEIENAIQDLQAQLKSEEARFNLNKISLERAKYETANIQKIKQLEYEQARIRINKIKRHLELKPRMNEYDRKIQNIKVQQKEAELEVALEALDKLTVLSPKAGLFQPGSSMFSYPPVDLKLGDQVEQGQLIAKIPDVTKMVVNTMVNEVDITKIRLGNPVIVRLDAMPKIPFKGEITYISRSCIEQDKEKIFKITVEIEESDLRLKPGMTVSCEYICYEGNNDLFVPNQCLFKDSSGAYIFIEKGAGFDKIKVTPGFSNTSHTVIQGELDPGVKLVPFEEILNQKTI